MRVYLCGAINGCNDEECRGWRDYAKTILPDTCDPMDRDYRGHETDSSIVEAIVEGDKSDIDSCDALLVMYEKPSVGTSMEILYAWERKKPVIVVCSEGLTLSPWMIYHTSCTVHSLKDACEGLLTMAYRGRRG